MAMNVEGQHAQSAAIEDAYRYCRQVTQRASKTFYWGSMFLPPPKRRAIWAIYAFCRTVDDIVDEACAHEIRSSGHLYGSSEPERELAGWRVSLEKLYKGGYPTRHPVLRAWSHILQHYPVPLEPALELLDGVEMDLAIKRYETFDDLYGYCYRVAGTVGLLTSAIFGYQDELALQHAVELGVALQLTNILRDIGEDARRNRIYLPLREMERFGYREEDLMAGVVNEGFRELVMFQIERTNAFYERSRPGIVLLSTDSRLAVQLSGALYHDILKRIRLNNYNVFTKRASVPLQNKLFTASTYWIMQQINNGVRGIRQA